MLLGLPPITLEPPPPPLRRKLDQQGSFEVIGSHKTMPDQHPEEPTILDFGEESLGPPKTPITDCSMPIIVHIYPYECQTVSHAAMEANATTYYGNSPIPTMTVTTRGVLPPKLPSPVRATMVSTASTSSSSRIPSLAVTTTPFT
jgi:hypothetical protein